RREVPESQGLEMNSKDHHQLSLAAHFFTRERSNDFRRVHAVLQQLDVQESFSVTFHKLKAVIVTITGRHPKDSI
ncbi:hypothetical protein, partial [Escherichia coli]|uniref:hypothetical protein n=1 Tax=Escherichia coli TaxID=562 RepID=UPI002381253C